MSETIELSADQHKAVSECRDAIRHGRWHILSGAAGTGKTTVVADLARSLMQEGDPVTLSAPTHKAVAVLKGKMPEGCHGTIHAVLKLRPDLSGPTKEFVPARRKKPHEGLVIIDESSMLRSRELGYVRQQLGQQAVLFVGDPYQLPPVGENSSAVFSLPDATHSRLTTVVRQSEDNPIIQLATGIRECIAGGRVFDLSRIRKNVNSKQQGVWPILDAEKLDRALKGAFMSVEFDLDPDHARYLAFTHAKVKVINERVRSWKYGQTDTPFVVGELARVVGEPIMVDDEIAVGVNEEVFIDRIEPWHVNQIPTWLMTVREAGRMPYTANVARDPEVLKRYLQDVKEKYNGWPLYHKLAGSFTTLEHAYAMTVHSSQGSTFKTAFLDVEDIAGSEDAPKMLYTGATRPSHLLIPCK